MLQRELTFLREESEMHRNNYGKALGDNVSLLGHKNSKQKIHYIDSLKQQISELLIENGRLRESKRATKKTA